MPMQTLTSLTQENKKFYDKALLARLLPELVFTKLGQQRSIPKNNGDTINFRKFNSLPLATTPLTEGVSPAGSDLSVSAVEATVKQYGDYVTISDKLDLMGIDPVLTETATLLGEQAGITIDTIVREELSQGTNVQVANSKTRETITNEDKLTVEEIQKAVRTLRKANVKPMSDGCYVFVIDPDCAYDIMNDEKWVDISKYGNTVQLMNGEVGKIAGVRVVQSTNIGVVSGGSDGSVKVHQNIMVGRDAFGVVDVDGTVKPEMIVIPAEVAGGPLKQKSTSGWKALFAVKRLNELGILRVECAASI
ncbi:MAG: N4-gp56 family major capsid protein [Clostridia bacterium]|nr:N4-gp56 family major capsid protein [Clostridia bacterium]